MTYHIRESLAFCRQWLAHEGLDADDVALVSTDDGVSATALSQAGADWAFYAAATAARPDYERRRCPCPGCACESLS